MVKYIVGLLLGLCGLLSSFLFGRKTAEQEQETKIANDKLKAEVKKKDISNDVKSMALQSLIDTNEQYLAGKRDDLKGPNTNKG